MVCLADAIKLAKMISGMHCLRSVCHCGLVCCSGVSTLEYCELFSVDVACELQFGFFAVSFQVSFGSEQHNSVAL